MLTKRQKEVLDFVKFFKEKKGYAPSLREIQEHLDIDSVSTAHYHISNLEKAGYLEKGEHQARSIDIHDYKIADTPKNKVETFFSVPLYGMANAGPATIFAEENLCGHVKIPNKLGIESDNLFALQVDGDSMNNANINGNKLEHGDFALIDPEYKNPRNGDYVLSIIDNCANLKKFERDKKTRGVKLVSESTKNIYKPIYISSEDDFMVNGKIIDVIKR